MTEAPPGREPVDDTTTPVDARVEPFRAEQLARIGVLLGAQRVEIYRRSSADHTSGEADAGYQLLGWWAALNSDPAPTFEPDATLPARWFPWSIGNLRPTEYLLVANAGALGVHPSSDVTIGDLGLESCMLVPVRGVRGRLLGAACVYWAERTERIPDDVRGKVSELARASLDRSGR